MPQDTPAIIVDIDGTLADCSWRLAKAKDELTGKMDWDVFYTYMGDDKIVPGIREIVFNFAENGHTIILMTGRPERFRKVTTGWLASNEVVYDELLMRDDNDRRPAAVFKKSCYQNEVMYNHHVILAIDDEPAIAKMWMAENIPCIMPTGLTSIREEFRELDDGAHHEHVRQLASALRWAMRPETHSKDEFVNLAVRHKITELLTKTEDEYGLKGTD